MSLAGVSVGSWQLAVGSWQLGSLGVDVEVDVDVDMVWAVLRGVKEGRGKRDRTTRQRQRQRHRHRHSQSGCDKWVRQVGATVDAMQNRLRLTNAQEGLCG